VSTTSGFAKPHDVSIEAFERIAKPLFALLGWDLRMI